MNRRFIRAVPAAAIGGLVVAVCTMVAGMSATKPAGTADRRDAKWAPTVEPKPLSNKVKAGLQWLVKAQHDNGGWSQGEESQHMGRSTGNIRDIPNVADTCAATLALIRAGSTPSQGPHAGNIRRGAP